MINASLDLFNLAKGKYETDYIKIAKMMDNKAGEAKIDNAIAEMETTALPELQNRYKKLMDIALPYAKKHGIKVTQGPQ
jgi:hypothetical protein